MSFVTRLVRRSGIFYFRMAVPRHLMRRIGRAEVKVSLRTSDPLTAKVRSRLLSNALDVMFGGLESLPEVSTATINDGIRKYFQSCLNESREYARILPSDPLNDIDAEIAFLSENATAMRQELKAQSFTASIRRDAEVLLKEISQPGEFVDLEHVHYARCAILRAKIENARILAAQLSGSYEEASPKDPLFAAMMADGLPPLGGEKAPVTAKALTLREVADRFLAFKSQHDFVAKTSGDVKRVLALAYEVIAPDREVKSITTADVKALRDLIASLPPNYMKGAANVGVTAVQASNLNESGATLSPQTQEKYLRLFKSLLMWATDEGYLDKTPGIKIKVAGTAKIKAIDQRLPYTPDQLKAIFTSPLYSGHKSETARHLSGKLLIQDGKFWTPLIALYSGMRMGEIVQLLRSDLKQEGGIWYFDVNKTEGDGKKLKTASSVRRVPIHEALIDLGFIKHFEDCPQKDRLFSDIECGGDGYFSHNFSKWWGRYSRAVSVWAKKTSFHSFRHNFKDGLSAAQVPEHIGKALMGHADSSVHGQYGSGPSLHALKEHIDRVKYPIEISVSGS